jgi:uroporphyrinogen-III synthase
MAVPESDGGLGGLAVMAFESRRASELESLIRRHGGVPQVVPSMREVPLQDGAARDLLRELEAGEINIVIILTGVGLRTLAERSPPDRLAASLARTTVVARGPKPIAELRKLGLKPQVSVPEPNTWREILATLDEQAPVEGLRVAVLEYGVTNEELISELERRGADVRRVALYSWALPEDPQPLRQAVSRLATTGVDVVLFTSRRQVEHVMLTASELGLASALVERARLMLVASIGPVCSEALRRHGLPVDLEPEHPKMGHLVVAVARRGPGLLRAKRA